MKPHLEERNKLIRKRYEELFPEAGDSNVSKANKKIVLECLDAITMELPASFHWSKELRRCYEKAVRLLGKK